MTKNTNRLHTFPNHHADLLTIKKGKLSPTLSLFSMCQLLLTLLFSATSLFPLRLTFHQGHLID